MSLLEHEPVTQAARHRWAPRRPRRTLLAAACVAGGALAVPFGSGSSSAVGTVGMSAAIPASGDTASGGTAVSRLEDAYQRSRTGTYNGVQLVMVDNQTHYVGVSHVPGHTYLYAESPSAQTLAMTGQAYETSDSAAATPSTDPLAKDPLALLTQHFRISWAGTDTVLGRPADMIEASTPAGHVAAKFWVDRDTSLVVQRETFDAHDNTYSKVAYLRLEVGASDPALQTVTATEVQPQGVEQDADRLDQLRSRGWWAQPELPGTLTLYDAREVAGTTGTVLHLSYSDGISTVSVFEQRGRLAGGTGTALPAGWHSETVPDGRRIVAADGVPVRAAWQAHDLVVAIIADVPPGTATSVIEALPYGAAPGNGTSVMGRVGRGLGRIGRMINPFG